MIIYPDVQIIIDKKMKDRADRYTKVQGCPLATFFKGIRPDYIITAAQQSVNIRKPREIYIEGTYHLTKPFTIQEYNQVGKRKFPNFWERHKFETTAYYEPVTLTSIPAK